MLLSGLPFTIYYVNQVLTNIMLLSGLPFTIHYAKCGNFAPIFTYNMHDLRFACREKLVLLIPLKQCIFVKCYYFNSNYFSL